MQYFKPVCEGLIPPGIKPIVQEYGQNQTLH